MSFIKQWILSVCITLIISVIFSVLAPNGSMGRFYKIVISVFIFASFIVPLVNFDFSDLVIDYDFETDYSIQIEDSAEANLKRLITQQLADVGINNAEIDMLLDKNKNDEIVIQNITVCINEKSRTEEIKTMLFNNLGLVCEVVSNE